MEISLIALFLLVRDSSGTPKCLGQAFLMALVVPLTAVYHHVLCKAFNPLLEFSPTSLQLSELQKTEKMAHFRHKALQQSSVVRLPRDKFGISHTEIEKSMKKYPDIFTHDFDASIDSDGGNIRLGL